jgi:hypothetical protein
MTAKNTAPKQRGRPFAKAQSGNPAGRPRGARNRATLAAEALLDGDAERLTRKAIKLALSGNTVALRLCLDRILPPRRDRNISLLLPETESAESACRSLAAIVKAVASGDLTSTEASDLGALLANYVKTIEATDFEARLRSLEAKAKTIRTNEPSAP